MAAMKTSILCCLIACLVPGARQEATADDIKKTELFARIKAAIDAVPAIDTHDHLRAFNEIPFRDETDRGVGMTLHSVWQGSYYPWINKLSNWPKGASFDEWWKTAKHDFDDARATSFYRYLLPAFRDLYGVDFETMTDAQARDLNDRIFDNYRDGRWLEEVVTRRANIELMFVDPYWARLKFEKSYRYSVLVLNVTEMVKGTHPTQFAGELDSPYAFVAREGKEIRSLDDYLAAIDAIFAKAVEADAACLKTTLAYQRTLRFENVPRDRAEQLFGRSPKELSADEQRDFEDFMFWRLCELSAKYDLPFQIHTGQARVQGSNPILLVDLIAANPNTKFVLFHGGFPWVGETGVIAMRHKNVWIDSVWLPTLSYTMAKRAYQEWLEMVPSDRIMWGADTVQAEGIYAATEFTRQCLAEALAEKVERDELREEQAIHIGRQIMRENALKLFPKLRRQLWRKEVTSNE